MWGGWDSDLGTAGECGAGARGLRWSAGLVRRGGGIEGEWLSRRGWWWGDRLDRKRVRMRGWGAQRDVWKVLAREGLEWPTGAGAESDLKSLRPEERS